MALSRAKISEPDRRFIVARSGGRCNKCKSEIFIENELSERARIGDDAHIWAYSEEGPRGKDSGAPAERNSPDNIILLCKNCHSTVDQQKLKFTSQALTKIRDEHYAWVRKCLGESPAHKPRFHYILYLNLPRTDMYAVANSIALPHFNIGTAQRIADLGANAGRLMATYTHVLNADTLYAHQIGNKDSILDLIIGQYCFLEAANFRTNSIDDGENLQSAWALNRSVIWKDFSDWALVCLIDPRWITTSTALSTFRSGWATLCGVVHVNRIDVEARKVYASPLFLAQPEG